ncbi:PIR protein, putative [Plasmodium sp. DRC-Itaito]|nr:PIR protein, putative [Plasmodium sp. DRC-Itaito]
MPLYCSKILLFVLTLNILVTSYQAHNKNKLYTTPQHTQTNRSLCECDKQSSNYDKDTGMKSVMQQFVDRTSQRFAEYEERLKDKRQKRKEERDKNIQEIVEKDKREKSLAEKVEKGCLRCGCALGGVAASVGVFGGLGVYGWKSAATAPVIAEATAKGLAAGAEEGVKALIKGLEQAWGIENLYKTPLAKFITKDTYCNANIISEHVTDYFRTLSTTDLIREEKLMLLSYKSMQESEGTRRVVESAEIVVREAVKKANDMTVQATATEMQKLKAGKLAEITTTSTELYSAIGYSVLAILIIVLVMIIIYLVLRYRRKKKMNKKAQYTKLLNQ